MRWLVAVVVFLIANLFFVSGTEILLSGHLAAGAAVVLLGALAMYAAVLIVMRIRARRT
jgi:hypothetical protein